MDWIQDINNKVEERFLLIYFYPPAVIVYF